MGPHAHGRLTLENLSGRDRLNIEFSNNDLTLRSGPQGEVVWELVLESLYGLRKPTVL